MEITSLLTQNVSAIVVVGAFLWYLTRRDRETAGSLKDLEEMLNKHMRTDIKIQRSLVQALQKLSDNIDNLSKSTK